MAASVAHDGMLLIQDERFADGRTLPLANRHTLVPILIGLAIPAVGVAVLAPGLLSNPGLVFGFYLMSIFVVSAVIFIRSVFNPGCIVEAMFDKETATGTFTRYGTFASQTIVVPFADMAKVYIETHYDQDGYKSFQPVVELKSGEMLQLPEGTTKGQVEAIKRILGR